MRLRRLFAILLCVSIVFSTMNCVVSAEDIDTDILKVGLGYDFETWTDAINAAVDNDNDGAITYHIYGKVEVDKTGWVSPRGTSGATTVNFVGMSDDAEICIPTKASTVIATDNVDDMVAINYTDLTLSRTESAYVSDLGHANNYFTTWMRGASADATVTYTECVFPNGSCNNQYGKTIYTDCTFENDTEYCLWIYGSGDNGNVKVNGGTFDGKKGVKIYSEDKNATVTTVIDGSEFYIDSKPAVVSSIAGTVELNNVDATNCQYGLLATEFKDHNTSYQLANVTVDGETPVYVASINGELYTNLDYAEAEAGTTKTVETPVALIITENETKGFSAITDAINAIADDSTLIIYEGEYDAALTVKKNNVTVKAVGEVLFTQAPTFKGTNYYVEGVDFEYGNGYNTLGGTGKIINCNLTADDNTFRYCYAGSGTIEFNGCDLIAGVNPTSTSYGWAIHFDDAPGLDLILTNCDVTGKVALAGNLGSLKATKTDFNDYYVNVWGTETGASFTKCNFNDVPYVFTGYDLDNTVEFDTCSTNTEGGIKELIYGGIEDADAAIIIDGVIETRKVKIGDKYYKDLLHALESAEDNDVLDLMDNTIKIEDAIKIKKDISIINGTIDVSGWNKGGEGIITLGERDGSNTVSLENVDITGTDYASAAGVFRLFNNSVLNVTDSDITLKNDTSESGGVFKGYDGTETFNLTNVNMTLEGTQRIIANAKGEINNLTVEAKNIGNHGFRNFAGTINDSVIDIDGCETGMKYDAGKSVALNNTSIAVVNAVNEQDNTGIVLLGGRDQLVDTNSVINSTIYSAGSVIAIREINVSADKSTVAAEEEIEINVTVKGTDLANAEWKLTYEPAKFELIGETNSGVIADKTIKTDGSVYADGEVIKTYKFKSIAQTDVTEADFVISDTYAYTYLESIDATKVSAINNEKVTVTIDLIEYELNVKFDGEDITDTTKVIPYDSKTHTFEVVTNPQANVIYEVNGVETSELNFKGEDTYVIKYKVDNAIGYAQKSGEFTLTITKPEYVVEVNTEAVDGSDFVSGKKIVLVYTNTDDVFFNYDNNLMIDVTAREYKYNGTGEYKHVFAIVVDAIENGVLADYEEKVKHLVTAPGLYTIAQYNNDLNYDDILDIRDITTAYGVLNVNESYFANIKYQKNILKADTDGNKYVNGIDTNAVLTAVYPN